MVTTKYLVRNIYFFGGETAWTYRVGEKFKRKKQQNIVEVDSSIVPVCARQQHWHYSGKRNYCSAHYDTGESHMRQAIPKIQ